MKETFCLVKLVSKGHFIRIPFQSGGSSSQEAVDKEIGKEGSWLPGTILHTKVSKDIEIFTK